MKKLLPIILIVIAAAGAGFYFLGRSQTGEEGDGNFVGSLTDALSLGQAMKCTFEEADTTGTVYIKGSDKLYAEFTTAGEADYLIYADNCIYSWGTEGQGVKMCSIPTEGKEELDFTEMIKEAELGLEEGSNYNCQKTVVNDSRFTPPSDVKFMEFPSLE